MFPELNTGFLKWILMGANVVNPVLQILGYEKIPDAKNYLYHFLISDGETWCYAYPETPAGQLSHRELEILDLKKFSIVQLNKYVCNQVETNTKVINVSDMFVLVPGSEVNGKLGNPVNSSASDASNRAIANLPAASDVPETGCSKDNELGACASATMCPCLTAGAISRILNEEDDCHETFVVQIIGFKKVADHYGLVIFDGVSAWPFSMLGTQLHHLIANKKLQKFAVVRVDEYEYKRVESGPKRIILLKITILKSGNEDNENFGDSLDSSFGGGATTNAPTVNVARTSCKKQKRASVDYSTMINEYAPPVDYYQFLFTMFPEVASGAINRILNGEEVENAVIQILGCQRVPGAAYERYSLLISDGVTSCPFGMLGTQLNHMVTNKELEKFTIVRVEKWVCNQVQDKKVIILYNLSVLVPGNEVDKVLGNPVSLPTVAVDATNTIQAVNYVAETGSSNNTVLACDSTNTMFPQLTTGAINQILNGEDVANAVIQILGCKKIPGAGNDLYRLLISDGVTACPFAMLGTQLNHMVANKELEKFTIVQVDKCVCNKVQPNRKVIILLKITVLVPGNDVNKELGNPVVEVAATTTPAVNDIAEISSSNDNVVPAHDSINIMPPQLTDGAINRILNWEDVANSVIQILGCKKIPGAGNDRYRLLISDGVTACPFAMLGTQLNHMVANKELEKFTIVRVDKCVCNQVQADPKVIILLSLSVLVPGNEVNEKLGNPVNSSTTNAPIVNYC